MFAKRRMVAALALVIAFFMFSGCYTAYKAARDERDLGTIASDNKIAADIKYQLMRDESVKGLGISVSAFYGHVYLVGAVENPAQKKIAIALAKSEEGVQSVKTYLLDKKDKTLGKSVDDTGISAQIRARMIKDKEMKSTQIKAKTILGHVVLMGVVETRAEEQKAIAHAKTVKKVKKVISFIRVMK